MDDVVINGNKRYDDNDMAITLPKTQLKPNQHWEEKRGIPVLVEVDPITGKRSIVICGGPAVDVEVIFQVEIDLFKGSATVITDTDVEILDGTKYEIYKQ